jgi:hypothetical protein
MRPSLELNRFHFLLARGREMETLRETLLVDAVRQLLEAADRYADASREPLRAWTARLETA